MDGKFKVLLNPMLATDLQEAVDYYHSKTKSVRLGNRFLDEVEATFHVLQHAPMHCQIRYDSISLLPIPPFPYCAH